MSTEKEHIDLFDRHLRKQLSLEEVLTFEERLGSDEAFRQDYEFYKLTVEGIREKQRIEIKEFLKENKASIFWGQNIWPRRMTYAAAAVLALFIGLYIILKQDPETSISKEISSVFKQEPAEAPIVLQDTIKAGNGNYMAIQEKASGEASDPPAAIAIEPDQEIMFDDVAELAPGVERTDIPFSEEKVEDYNVLSDTKLKDTLMSITLIAVNLDNKNLNYNNNLNISNNISTSRTKAGKIPAAAQNETARTFEKSKKLKEYKTETFTDSIAVAAASDNEKDGLISGSTLNTSFWKSPVNYKGYSYDGKKLKLYGVKAENIRLFNYNNVIYIRTEGTVYSISLCPEYCQFVSVNDNNIMLLILNQP